MKHTTFTLVVVTLATVAGGCHRGSRCAAGTPSKIEVRNGSGALTLAWKGDALCDGNLALVGTLETKKDTVTHALQEYIARREQAKIVEMFGTLEWDETYDYKEARGYRDRKLGLAD